MKKKSPTNICFTLKASILTLLLIGVATFAQAQACGCDYVINPPDARTTSLVVDGALLGVKPGQTICLTAGFYMQVRVTGLMGVPGNPVTIKNCGGLVEIGDVTNFGRWYAVDIRQSKYFRFTGSGDAGFKYGIKVGKSGDTGIKVGASTDSELDHLEIANTGFAGIMAKSDFGGNPPVDAMEMNNVNIHDNYVHDTRGEGMYIGETKTPGQNFRHLQVWNNIVTRSGLELIQVANVIEDAQVYNNVLHKGGTRNVLYQNKGLQIGDNSVGRYYNNILTGSPSNLMIIMGSGNIDIFNNYLAKGMSDAGFFIDNRSITIPSAPINIYKNYILEVNEIFPFFNVFNEKNPVNITENKLEGNNVILGFGSGAGPAVTESGNTREVIERVQFVDIDKDNFALVPGSPYQGMGVLEDVSNLNKRPFVSLLPHTEMDFETQREIPVSATDPDGDAMVLEVFNLPPFVTFKDNGNGNGMFNLAPQLSDLGIYYKVRVRVTDSKGGMNTQNFNIKVLDPYAFIATASSSGGTNYPANTLDGNLTIRWAAADGIGQWIQYDLREDKLVTSVKIAFYNGTSIVHNFDMEMSADGSNWIQVFSGASSGISADFETFSFDESRGRYLRIIDRKNSLNSYNEVVINCTTAPQVHRFHPIDDVYLEGKTVYDNTILKVKQQHRKSFIRFAVTDLDVLKSPVISARLKLKGLEKDYGSLKIYLGEQSNWSESNLNLDDLPQPVRALDTLATNFVSGQVYELNLLNATPDNGVYNFILVLADSKRGISFSSREGAFQPELEIQTLRGAEPMTASFSTISNMLSSDPVSAENSFGGLRLFPNPASDKITLDLGHESKFVNVEISDQDGMVYYRQNWLSAQKMELDIKIPGMNPGIYFVKVQQQSEPVKILRLVKH